MSHQPPATDESGRPAPPTATPPRRDRRWTKLLLLGGSSLIALGIGEVGARWLRLAPPVQAIRVDDPDSPYRRSANPILRFELKPGYQRDYVAQHYALRSEAEDFQPEADLDVRGRVTINSHGLRDRERTIDKPPGTRRIVLLGDSVVEMINYVSDDETISRCLEAIYQDAAVEVLNVGTAGYCTRAEVELFEQKALPLQPDQVIVLFVENDFWGYNLEHSLGGSLRPRPQVVEQLFAGSHLFRACCLGLNLWQYRTEHAPAEWHRHAIGDNNVVDGFARLRELTDAHGFDVAVAIWPRFEPEEIFDEHFVDGTQDLVVERLAWSFGFPTLRLSQAFLDDWHALEPRPKAEWRYTNGDGMHPSPLGCRLAADALHRALEEPTAEFQFRQPPPGTEIDLEQVRGLARELALGPEEEMSTEARIAWVLRRQNRWIEADHFERRWLANPGGDFPDNPLEKPDLQREHYQAGLQFLQQEEFHTARDLLERAVALDPLDANAHEALGQALKALGDVEGGEASLAEARRLRNAASP